MDHMDLGSHFCYLQRILGKTDFRYVVNLAMQRLKYLSR